jgi:hypothetical protein
MQFFLKKQNKKMPTKNEKTPTKVAQKYSIFFIFITALSCPKGLKKRIHVPKCGLMTKCI